jgi:hypothetical protein
VEEMFNTKSDVFDTKFRGSFGQFSTNKSNPSFYFLTSLPIKGLRDTLKLAVDALPIATITFSQMIQRDVIPDHVDDIKKFIVSGAGRAVFFPPLLVSIISKNAKNEIQDMFESFPEGVDTEKTRAITWDKNLFKITLWGQKQEGDGLRRLQGIGGDYYYHDYGAHLELNSNRSSLVVIDGQHRYKALASLYEAEDFRPTVEAIEVPICVVFSPFAVKTSGLEDLREIFIKVNNEGKQVSGHFYELLRDTSYASEAVRRLAERWKSDVSRGYSLLHHLEWNTYDQKRAGNLNRSYSITTVLVIADALRESVFAKTVAPSLLQLTAIQEQLLAVDPDFNIDNVVDIVEHSPTKQLIYEQISKHVVESLHILFVTFSPFAGLCNETQARMTKLREDKNKGDRPEVSALYEMFEQHKIPAASADTPNGGFPRPEIQLAYNEFAKGISSQQEAKAPVTRYTVFHHALIRSWAQLSRELIKQEILPVESAAMLIAGFEKSLASNDMKFLSPSVFTQRMLWNGDQVNFKGEWAKKAWADLMLSTMALKSTQDAAIARLEKDRAASSQTAPEKKKLVAALKRVAVDAAIRYLDELENQTEKYVKRYYADMLADDQLVEELRALQISSDAEDKQKFADHINKLTAERFAEAEARLAAVLGLSADELAK